ncbi:MAG: response regulator transcription factor [Chloroflexota bacterium]|nr:MAG: response regulator transcription factor [Chloroflexota bacterium]
MAANLDTPLQQRVLAVDDDGAIRDVVRLYLENAGFYVWTAAGGAEALAMIRERGLPHLAIVDLDMPGMTGFEFCHTVLGFSDLPMIILTATQDEDVVVEGIQQYAEDYVTKPFSPRELVARTQRVLRRIGDFKYTLAAEINVDEHLAVDFANQRARVDGNVVELTPTESKLLYLLMRNGGSTVLTDFLLRRLWPQQDVFEDALRVHIRHLRQKIERDPSSPTYLLTERGMGYRFIAPYL